MSSYVTQQGAGLGEIWVQKRISSVFQVEDTLSKLARRPREGTQISIQLRVADAKGRVNSLGLESF